MNYFLYLIYNSLSMKIIVGRKQQKPIISISRIKKGIWRISRKEGITRSIKNKN